MQNKEIEEAKKTLKNNKVLFGIQKDICLQARVSIEILLQYIEQLENKVKELGKGQHTLMQSRRKWKNRYYKEKRTNVK